MAEPTETTATVTSQTGAPLTPAVSEGEIAAARGYVEASRAASTRRAYDGDWRRFSTWCRERGAPTLPASPELVAVYLSALAKAGKAPADAEFLSALLGSIAGDGLAAVRDRALLAVGMALAARRSELVALKLRDLDWSEQGLRVTIRRSKTDQEGAGAVVAVPEGRTLKPLVHLRAWLTASGITAGPVFRPLWKSGKRVRDVGLSDHAVARILHARVRAAEFDPARYGGHSLRAGFVTAAARAGADVWKIQQVSRHRSMQVLAGYVRDARLFDDHAGDGFL